VLPASAVRTGSRARAQGGRQGSDRAIGRRQLLYIITNGRWLQSPGALAT